MRISLIVPAALTCVLAAQPAPENLVQRFNDGLKGINQLMAELKFQEAADQAQGLVPAQAPVFNPKDAKSIGGSIDNGRGMLALLKLQATTVVANGQWEKALEINQKRVDYARALQADVDKTMTTLEAPWIKAVAEGKAYIAENTPKIAEMEKSIAKLQQDIKDFKEKKLVLDKKQQEEINTIRGPQAAKDEQEIGRLKAQIAAYENNIKRFPDFQKYLAENRKDTEAMVKEAEEALEKAKAPVKTQTDEIAAFNTQQLEKNKKKKKFKIEGSKNWVEAIMRDKTNLTKLDTPRAQAQFLNRLLVLDPTNKPAAAALENLKAGRTPFFVDKKAKKRAKK